MSLTFTLIFHDLKVDSPEWHDDIWITEPLALEYLGPLLTLSGGV